MLAPINEFCDKKSLPETIRKAFIAYCQALYGSRYMMKEDGETIKIFLSRMTEDQINEAWLNFISDMKNILPQETSGTP